MDKRSIILVVSFLALVVVGMFIYAYLKRAEITAPAPVAPAASEVEVGTPYPNVTRIEAKHFFIDGVHTLVGQVELPTPCDLLETGSVVKESMPEQVELQFSVINNAESCAQIITAQRFMITATASQGATFTARFMGRELPLNLIPAQPGETPEEFELFIKG
jgi:hypothetical protein